MHSIPGNQFCNHTLSNKEQSGLIIQYKDILDLNQSLGSLVTIQFRIIGTEHGYLYSDDYEAIHQALSPADAMNFWVAI